jgi:hypothetical protein
MQTRFAGARCMISDLMPINRHKARMRPSATSKQACPALWRSRRQPMAHRHLLRVRLPPQLQRLHLQLHRLQRQPSHHGRRLHRGRARSQGLGLRQRRVRSSHETCDCGRRAARNLHIAADTVARVTRASRTRHRSLDRARFARSPAKIFKNLLGFHRKHVRKTTLIQANGLSSRKGNLQKCQNSRLPV